MITKGSPDSSGAGPHLEPSSHPRDDSRMPPVWWRVTLASIGDAVIATDDEAHITFLNPVAESLTGWTHLEAANQPLGSVFRIINEASRLPVENHAIRALREGVPVVLSNHCLLIAKDGTEVPIDDSAAPIRNDSGELRGVVLVFRDVSERRAIERLADAALVYADNIIATLREPFLVLDADLRVRTANASFYRAFKVAKGATEGQFIYDLGDRQWDIPRLRTLLEEVLPKNQSIRDFAVVHEFPTLGRKVMLLNAQRVSTVSGLPDMILLAIEDTTMKANASVALGISELRYRRLFETAKDGILILDAVSGRIIDANPYMTELLGYSHAEFLGQELWQIGLFSDKAQNESAYRELQTVGYLRYEHLPLQTTHGKRVEVEFVSNVYSVDDLRVVQCNIRDISDRSRLERQTQEQAAELSDLHRRKDEFLAMLSHELRNPIAPIMNAVQLLRMQQGNENLIQLQARTIIARQVDHLKHLVDDLLEVSRINTGRIELRLERVGVNGIIEGAIETARPVIDQARHTLYVSLPVDIIWLHADAARLEQVVVNLLTNAAKYMDPGGGIWLSAVQEGDFCVLRVRDTGIGIGADLLPRIFDLFTQAERLLDRSQGGLGIGLSLVQRLTELHGGTVKATSVFGEGSEFVVRLPVAPLSTLGRPAPAAILQAEIAGSLRVMVVDDNLDMAESLALLVRALGHEARAVHDGATALQLASQFLPNAVLLDIGLPGLNGYAVAKQLRMQEGMEDAMLVAVTGYGRESDVQRAIAEGFDRHLVKPPDFESLQAILSNVSAKLAVR